MYQLRQLKWAIVAVKVYHSFTFPNKVHESGFFRYNTNKMGAKIKPSEVSFQSMPNFRIVGGVKESIVVHTVTPYLYRSSRPDFLAEAEVIQFQELGIRTVLDFRSPREYRKANSNHLLDHIYPVLKIKSPMSKYKPGEKIQHVSIEFPPPKADI